MVIYNGHDMEAWYTAESTFGTAPTDATWTPFIEAESVEGGTYAREVKDRRRIGKRGRSGSPRGIVDIDTLTFSLPLTDDDITADTYTAFIKSLFDEDYDESTPSYSILLADSTNPASSGSMFIYFYGCELDSVTFNISSEDEVMLELVFFVRDQKKSATELHTSTGATYTAHPSDTSITYIMWSDVTAITKGGSFTNTGALTSFIEMDIEISQNNTKHYRLNGSKLPKRHHAEGYDVSGSITMDFENLEQFDEIEGEKNGSLAIQITPASGALATITLNGLSYDDDDTPVSANELMTEEISFTADSCTFA